MATAPGAHLRQHGTCHVHRPEQIRGQLRLDLRRRHLLEVTLEGATRIVDQHVDPPEAVDRRLHGIVGAVLVSDIKRHHQQPVMVTDRLRGRSRIPARGDDAVSGAQRRLGELDTHATAGARDEPHLLTHRRLASLHTANVGVADALRERLPVPRSTATPAPGRPGRSAADRRSRGIRPADPRCSWCQAMSAIGRHKQPMSVRPENPVRLVCTWQVSSVDCVGRNGL